MKCNNEDLEKAKLYEIIDAGIDQRKNIIFQMLFSKKGNEDLLQDFLEKLLKRKIKKLLKSGMNIEKISSLIDMPVSKVKKMSML